MSDVESYIRSVQGGTVSYSRVGYGSLFEIDVRINPVDEITLWFYQAAWVLLSDNEETLAYDMDVETFRRNSDYMLSVTGCRVLSVLICADEIHFEFDRSYRLEVWSDLMAYERGSQLIRVFLNRKHVGDIENP